MSFGKNSNESAASRSEKPSGKFPEKHHSDHKPSSGQAMPEHIKKSESLHGHQDSMDRMSHPQGYDWPDQEPSGSAPGSNQGHKGVGHTPMKPSPFSGD